MASVATIESRLLSRTGVTPQLAKTWIENVDRQMGKEKNSRSHKTTEQLAAFK